MLVMLMASVHDICLWSMTQFICCMVCCNKSLMIDAFTMNFHHGGTFVVNGGSWSYVGG